MGLFHSIFGLPQPARQNNISGPGHTTLSSGNTTPSLVQGTVVKGEVIDLRSNQVTIRLDDGSTLHAKLATAMDLAIGQRADFFVQETNDVLITLKLLSDGDTSFTEAVIDKALEAAGLPKSAHNADIVRSLLDAGLPAGKEMIQKMMQYSAANNGVELSTLTALIKHNLPVTKENAAGLQTYRNFEHRLAGQASSLAASLTEALTDDTLPTSLSKQFSRTSFHRQTVSPKLYLLRRRLCLHTLRLMRLLHQRLRTFRHRLRFRPAETLCRMTALLPQLWQTLFLNRPAQHR